MTKQPTTTRRQLAHRSSDGVQVTLLWSQSDGIDELVVCVSDIRAGAYFEIPAEPAVKAGRKVDHLRRLKSGPPAGLEWTRFGLDRESACRREGRARRARPGRR